MNYAILINDDSNWGQASGLGAQLARLGFTLCADIAAVPVLNRCVVVRWVSDGSVKTSTFDDIARARDCMRFVVMPADTSDSARAALAERFDSVLTTPIDEVALCTALAAQRYDAIAPLERQSLHAKVLELACDDAATATHLLQLIADTNRVTLALLLDGFDAASWDIVGSAAHRIAGSARMLDCGALLALLIRLETAARERHVALAKALIPLVVNALESLDASVQEVLKPLGQY